MTALQLDTKVSGLPTEVLAGALKQARERHLFILDAMLATLPEPRMLFHPRLPGSSPAESHVDKIGEVIRPQGSGSTRSSATTGADIDIQDDGTVFLGSKEGDGAERAWKMIEEILNPRIPEVGEVFEGKVVGATTFGAFVNMLPGRTAWPTSPSCGRAVSASSPWRTWSAWATGSAWWSSRSRAGPEAQDRPPPLWEGEEPPSVEELLAERGRARLRDRSAGSGAAVIADNAAATQA